MINLQFSGLFYLILLLGTVAVIPQTKTAETGKPAPDFSLKDQAGKTQTLSDYKNQWVLVYFYPKDDTPGCTTEACSFRDRYEDFRQSGLKVFGISADNVKSHLAFAEKYNLPFSLLADTTGEVIRQYGVKMPIFKTAKRQSFLIDPEGNIRKIYEQVTPADHPEEILADLRQFKED